MRFSTPLGLRAAALIALAAVALPLAAPSPAAAQEPSKVELAKARNLFSEAVALASGNNCAAALVKYKEVAQIKSTPQVSFNTAECEARLGQLVSALGNYRVAASQAAEDKKNAAVLREILKQVPARIEDLEARIPKLTVTRGKGADTAAIELDGTELGTSQLGSPVPVDPGTHTVVARVSGKEYLHKEIKLDEKDTKTFDVKISVAAPVVEPPASETKPDEVKPPEGKSKAPGAVLVAAGGALIVVGLALLAPRQSDINKLNGDCMMGHCPAADSSIGSQGQMLTILTGVFVPAGVVGVVVGAVLLAKSGPPAAEKKDDDKKDGDKGDKKDAVWRSIQVVPGAPGATVGGLSLVGRF